MNALNGNFVFNGASFNMDVINYTIPLDNTEIWHISNNSPIGHPFHIHDVQFYIIERNGSVPSVDEMGRKDVVFVPAMQSVKFICKFEDFADPEIPYMYHCHMLVHEDGGMMGQFLVTDPNASLAELAPEELSVFPNPASDQIQLDLPPATTSITIRDLLGRTVMDLPTAANTQTFDVSALISGTYFGLARNNGGEVIGTFQILVAH
jgi:bilirubin oxidase